ncbi:homeodomain-interacting protein kinase 2-like isoform X1 [Xiphophorus couchianus]|uniref:homeodomain-interacting protein kinase 2-like isoform X1 n=1 Tax=Xiphophorus couchianus TaxID=32473 RepID=UPI00101627F3|nr:homeodomain-interacting protein kinase 2-like isoform X1 [Xiphophorus couchianus]XP_027884915.1 homeodomain-interacting protein kinase 2-like isoform X1 [Xiphophorus couchianus]
MGIGISSPSSDYEMEHYLGSGAYGAVVQSKKLTTNETVALKVIKNERYMEVAKKEVEILQYLKGLGSDKFNIVMLNDSFTHVGCYYMEFEKLDINLTDFLRKKPRRSLEQKEICPIVHQLATTLDFLQSVGIVHADLKPENIMIVDEGQKPVRVKIIDFGLALKNPEEHRGAVLQTLWYRCPEVLLGAAFSGAIDVWSLGCIVVEMFTGSALFPGENENEMIKHIVLAFGNPPEYLLNSGLNTMQFFNKNDGEEEPCGPWTLRRDTQIENVSFIPQRTLDFLNMLRENVSDENGGESERDSFVELVADMLKLDSAKRISPSEILLHPFVAKSHLADNSIHEKSSSSAGSKTKIDQNDNAESGNRSPDAIPAKRRKDCEDVEMTCAQTSPSMSPSQK